MGESKEKMSLTSDDVCAIIEASAKNEVSVLKFGDLHIEFGMNATQLRKLFPPPDYPVSVGPLSPLSQPPSPAGAAIPETQHDKMNKNAIENEELRLREEEIANAIIENPLLAEELLREGELEDDDDGDGDDESGD